MNWSNKKAPSTQLGLTLDGSSLEASVVRRTNGSIEIVKSITVPLTLDPLKNEPELVGREIRNQLDAAGIRERHVVVGIPLHWAFSVQTPIPAIEEPEIPAFLEIEAERGFPRAPEELQIATSRLEVPGSHRQALQVGIPKDYVARLNQIMAAAKLKPASFSIAIAALPTASTGDSEGRITAYVGETSVELLVACGGGIAVLRTLPVPTDHEGTEKRILSEPIAREIRVTLGQLPEEVRDRVRRIAVLGQPQLARTLRDDLRSRAESLGLTVDPDTDAGSTVHGLKVLNGLPPSPAVCLAARSLAGRGMGLEFLPPKATFLKQLTTRYSARKLAWTVSTSAAVLLVAMSAFLYQQIRLSSLRSQWNAMRPKVAEIEALRTNIRMFRPWNDASTPNLDILRTLSETLPEDGAVSAKSVEIRQPGTVSLSGTARDNASLLRTIAKLRESKQVANVQVDQIRGKSPLLFTFNFTWTETPAP